MSFFHEPNHVELGHLDFAIDHLGLNECREINATPVEAKDAAILRALELEADLAALHRSLKVWRAMISYSAAERTGNDIEWLTGYQR